MVNKEYYERMKNSNLKLLIVGRDPYPKNETGIPFQKSNIKEQLARNKSGYYILKGLGIEVDQHFDSDFDTKTFFIDLLKNGIGFVNASINYLKGENNNLEKTISESIEVNNEILKNKDLVILATKSSLPILRKYKMYLEVYVIPHPSPMGRNAHPKKYFNFYEVKGGLLNKLGNKQLGLTKINVKHKMDSDGPAE